MRHVPCAFCSTCSGYTACLSSHCTSDNAAPTTTIQGLWIAHKQQIRTRYFPHFVSSTNQLLHSLVVIRFSLEYLRSFAVLLSCRVVFAFHFLSESHFQGGPSPVALAGCCCREESPPSQPPTSESHTAHLPLPPPTSDSSTSESPPSYCP